MFSHHLFELVSKLVLKCIGTLMTDSDIHADNRTDEDLSIRLVHSKIRINVLTVKKIFLLHDIREPSSQSCSQKELALKFPFDFRVFAVWVVASSRFSLRLRRSGGWVFRLDKRLRISGGCCLLGESIIRKAVGIFYYLDVK